MLTIERSLNVYAAGIPQIINLSQYDDDFQLVFSLYTSEGAFTVPSGTTAEIMGTKVDGNGYSADATISGNTVTVTGNNQMTACAGRNVFEIVLTNSGKRLATINFILQVERAALDADTIQSETVLRELNAIIDGVDRAEDAAERAEEAEAVVTESLDKKAPVIINTSDEAEVVTFADGADDMPMKSVVLKLVPHQEGSGDPSPSNVRPISGYTSINVTRTGKISDPTFEPYQSNTYPITLPQTVYGGELDVVSGKLKIEWIKVTENQLNWTYDGGRWSAVISNPKPTGNARSAELLAEQYPVTINASASVVGAFRYGGCLFVYNGNSTEHPKGDYVYPLATPTVITLDKTTITTLLGSNTIWMDADGTIQCDYPADTKKYIDALTAPDDDMIADSNIASGKYFTVNNRLYISTSAIAQGEQIVVGTNCVKTDLATALNALNA